MELEKKFNQEHNLSIHVFLYPLMQVVFYNDISHRFPVSCIYKTYHFGEKDVDDTGNRLPHGSTSSDGCVAVPREDAQRADVEEASIWRGTLHRRRLSRRSLLLLLSSTQDGA